MHISNQDDSYKIYYIIFVHVYEFVSNLEVWISFQVFKQIEN
jgi:hypothetical protein